MRFSWIALVCCIVVGVSVSAPTAPPQKTDLDIAIAFGETLGLTTPAGTRALFDATLTAPTASVLFRLQLSATVGSGLSAIEGKRLARDGMRFSVGILDGVALLMTRAWAVEHKSTQVLTADSMIATRRQRSRITVPLGAERELLLQQAGVTNEQQLLVQIHEARRTGAAQHTETLSLIHETIQNHINFANHRYVALRQRPEWQSLTDPWSPRLTSTVLSTILREDQHVGFAFLLFDHSRGLAETIAILKAAGQSADPEDLLWQALRYTTPPALSLQQPQEITLTLERPGDTIGAVLRRYTMDAPLAAVLTYNNLTTQQAARMPVGAPFRIPAAFAPSTPLTPEQIQQRLEAVARIIHVEPDHIQWQLHYSRTAWQTMPPELVLALLYQETRGGSNPGKPRDIAKNMTLERRSVFFDWCAQWGVDPFLLPMSPRHGALGDTQFLPETWESHADHIREATNHGIPWPWNIADAVAATNIYLSGTAGFQGGDLERALHFYFMGSMYRKTLEERPRLAFYARSILHRSYWIRKQLEQHKLFPPS